jgi:signal transduction histidine kinase
MTLRHRFTASLAALLLLVALAAVVTAWASTRTAASLDALREAAERRTRLAAVQHAVLDRAREVAIVTELPLTAAQERALAARLDDLVAAVEGLERGDHDSPDRGVLRRRVAAFGGQARRAYALVVAGDRGAAAGAAGRAGAEAEALLALASARMEGEEARVRVATDEFVRTTRTAGQISLGTLLFSLFGALGLAAAASVHVTRGVTALRRGAEALGAQVGEVRPDLGRVRVVEAGDDEFRDLAQAFNGMAARLEAALADASHARERAERASAAKSAFLCNMSHELRTPLTALLGYADLVHASAAGRGDVATAEDAEQIRAAGRMLLSLVNQIVDLAKLQRGRLTVQCLELSLREIAVHAVALMRPLAERNRNRLTLTIHRDPGLVVTDGMKVQQILLNLLGNACKFTADGEIALEIDRRVVEEGDRVVIVVRDTGIGMTDEQAARIFEEFEQAEPSTERAYGGSGLGLAITRGLCDVLGGRIAVTSAPGGGTAFTVHLPPVSGGSAHDVDPPLALGA